MSCLTHSRISEREECGASSQYGFEFVSAGSNWIMLCGPISRSSSPPLEYGMASIGKAVFSMISLASLQR